MSAYLEVGIWRLHWCLKSAVRNGCENNLARQAAEHTLTNLNNIFGWAVHRLKQLMRDGWSQSFAERGPIDLAQSRYRIFRSPFLGAMRV